MNEEVEPDGPGETHQHGLDNDQQQAIEPHPPEQPVIVQGKADEHLPGDKRGDTNGNGQGIAHKTGAIPESGFYLEALAAYGTVRVHLHIGFQVIGVVSHVKVSPAATGTFVMENAGKKRRSMMAMPGIYGIDCTHMFVIL